MPELTTKTPEARSLPHRRMPPGPRGRLLLGSAPDMQSNRLGFLLNLTRQYGDVSSMRFVIWPSYLINHPQDVKRVLQENHRNYNKDVFTYKVFHPFLGKGLLTNDGSSWLHQRRLIQPTFHRKHLATFGTLMTGATTSMLERWQGKASSGESLDIFNEMMRLTQRIVGQTLFSIDLDNETDTVGQAVTTLSELLSGYIYAPFPPLSVPTSRNRRMQAATRTLDNMVYRLINERRQQPGDTNEQAVDLLSLLLSMRDEETGQGMNDKQMRDEVITLLVAGHETTSNLLTWTWYLLSQHPEVERRLHAEVDRVLGGQLPTVEKLSELRYTHMILEETLRLYPPAWIFSRKAIADDKLGGYDISKNSMVILSPYTTHRHPDFWENPEQFDPERFTPERSAKRPHYAYFPFGGSPRMCIGSNFAMMEAQLILTTIAQRYSLRLLPDHPVEPEALITLRPKYGLPMFLQDV
jgi:cytochrome P450